MKLVKKQGPFKFTDQSFDLLCSMKTVDKSSLIEFLIAYCSNKYEDLNKRMQQLRVDLNSESKSTAGDKHETGRAMIQLEMEKMQAQLQIWEQHLTRCKSLDSKKVKKIETGALAKTNKGHLFFGVGLGQISFKQESIFCIAMNAPIAQAMISESAGSSVNFQNTLWTIEAIN